MSWCIQIIINEDSKAAALELLDKAVQEIKINDDIFVEGGTIFDGSVFGPLPHSKYDSYEGMH